MTHRHIEIVTTIALAVVAALFVSYIIFLFAISPRNTYNPFLAQQSTAPVDEVQVLQAMTPAPASAATVAKEAKTLTAVSQTSAKSNTSVTDQQKLSTLSSMNASQ